MTATLTTRRLRRGITARTLASASLDRGEPGATPAPRIVRRLHADPEQELRRLREGLAATPAHIDPKYFYDAQGGSLFSAICSLQEYYLTRVEASIFSLHRQAIAEQLPPGGQWIDLGCGDAGKSLEWILASKATRFLGVDIALSSLDAAVARLARTYPQLECLGVLADFSAGLGLHDLLAERSQAPPIFFYPGSSIGNFTTEQALTMLRRVRAHLDDGGCLLIGIDLVKDIATMEAAYDDALGVTAAFNRNILRVVNGLIDADFRPEAFEHQARFDARASRIEMRLCARQAQNVRVSGQRRCFEAGESIVTEYAHKYRSEDFTALLARAGFSRQQLWTDERGWFGVFLASP